jgi:hypothetical protein
MITRSALIAAALVAFAAGGLTTPPEAIGAEPYCVFLLPDVGGETLINRCNGCREVTLERTRPGSAIPNIRSMMLPPEDATPAPFRGPGRTRILGERTCPRPPGHGVSGISYGR